MLPWPLLVGLGTTLIERIFPDKEAQDKAKAEMMTIMNEAAAREIEAKSKVVIAEAKGESWMQRNWRPSLMFTFIIIFINNFILLPYAQAFGLPIQALPIPGEMWAMLSIGLGGYVVGRSAEKIARHKFNSEAFFNEYKKRFGRISSQETVDALNAAIAKGKE